MTPMALSTYRENHEGNNKNAEERKEVKVRDINFILESR
jgi:hypothetical protein